MEWIQQFSRTTCTHIQKQISYHCILLLDTNPVNTRRKKRFIFDNRWLNQNGMNKVVREAWKKESEGSRMFNLIRKIKACKDAVTKWNKKVHINVARKIKELKEQIDLLKL